MLKKISATLGAALLFPRVFARTGHQQPVSISASALQLGAFSISLSVKDLNASHAFYEKLGFSAIGGDLPNIT